jgi:bifunctional DNA-binding transcriptional regulator/antitoxin component of YhaV-PrlF toxin-antitoxin module
MANKGSKKMPVVRIREKNQITLPQIVMNVRKLRVGDFLEVSIDDKGCVFLDPIPLARKGRAAK